MLTIKDVRPAVSQSWDFVNVQDWQGVLVRLNSSGVAYSANGLGGATAASTAVAMSIAGASASSGDQRVTGTIRYSSPTTSSNCNLGLMLRMKSLQNSADTNYYIARVHQGIAKITPVNAGVVGNSLSQSAFALPADTDVTITFSAIGTALSASFVASGLTTVNLSAVDSSIVGGGFMGFRSTSQVVFCSAITCELL